MRAEAVLAGQGMPSHMFGDEGEIRGLECLDAGRSRGGGVIIGVVGAVGGSAGNVGTVVGTVIAGTVTEAVEQGPQTRGRALHTQMSPGQVLQIGSCQCRLVE